MAEGQYLVTIECAPYEQIPMKNIPLKNVPEKNVPDSAHGDGKDNGDKGDEKIASNNDNAAEEKEGVEGEKGQLKTKKRRSSAGEVEVEIEESKTEGTSLQEEKEEENISTTKSSEYVPDRRLSHPTIPPTVNTTSVSTTKENVQERYGIIEGEGSVWVEWLVNCSRGGSISVGAITAEAAHDPDAR